MRGTPEGRRLLGGCVLGGAGVGVLAAAGAAYAFKHTTTLELCGPTMTDVCRRLDLAGFELRSSTSAAATVGPIIGFLAFLVIMIVVLYTSDQQRR